ncbi:MAG: sensor histidine kinase [Micromonosporaceae bacterium]
MNTARLVEFLRSRHWAKNGVAWPWWIPACFVVLSMLAAVGAAVQRDALFPPGLAALFALLGVSPWLFQITTGKHLPAWLFALVVNVSVVALVVRGRVDIDLAPLLLLLLAGELAATEPIRTSIPAAVVSVVLLVGLQLAGAHQTALFWGVCLLVAWDVGFIMQWQMRMVERERATAQSRAEEAAVRERQRIAREVHDVVAHSLSVTMLHLTAARHNLEGDGEADVDEAVDALRDAERIGREAMADIRRTVGLLGTDGAETRPLPGVPDIAELVDGFRSAGMTLTYELRGDPAVVPQSAGLGLYRIAQESLSNVAKHAAGARVRATLDLDAEPRSFTVWNSLAQGGAERRNGGSGLKGIAERAELMGGASRVGPDGTGWRVRVEFPSDSRSPAPSPGCAATSWFVPRPAEGTP